jgi:hypothetical protein
MFIMVNSREIKLAVAVVLSISLWIFVTEAKSVENSSLDTIIAGITRNDGLIANISFDYTVEYNVSEEWRIKRLEFTKKQMVNNRPEGMEMRVPTLEHTLRTGTTTFERDKFKTTSKWLASSDQKVFQDEIVAYDGVKLTELDIKENAGNISSEVDKRKAHLTFDPRNFPVLFVDGQPLHSALTAKNTTTRLVGTEEIDDTLCYVIEMVKSFMTPEGVREQSSRKCWIATDKGFRVKKAISYGTNSFDSKPLSVTQCELTEVANGIWYYSKVTFESYPLSLPKPDVIETLELKNIVVNQGLKESTFAITFPQGCLVDDKVADKKYKVGDDPNAPKEQPKK